MLSAGSAGLDRSDAGGNEGAQGAESGRKTDFIGGEGGASRKIMQVTSEAKQLCRAGLGLTQEREPIQ